MEPCISITRSLSITGPATRHQPWVIAKTRTVDGHEFIPLCSRDAGFARFVMGKSGIRLGRCTLLKQMTQLRIMASYQSILTDKQPSLFDDAPAPNPKAKKRLKSMCVEAKEMGTFPDVVLIVMPEAVLKDGTVLQSIAMRVLTDTNFMNTIWVQACEENLQYISAIIADDEGVDPAHGQVRSLPVGVRWRAERDAFLATRKCDGVEKTFRVEGDDDASKATALSHAVEWTDAVSECAASEIA